MKYKICGLGAKFAGKCVKCGSNTGSKDWEKAQTLLLKDEDGNFMVAHGNCLGRIKTRVGGEKVYIGPEEIEA